MNILYIWDADYPWDVRVEKICKTLAQSGHTAHIAARNLKRRPVSEVVDDLHIHRIRPWNSERLNYALTFPAFFSPVWGRFLDRVIEENSIEAIIVRDLPMAIAGIWAGHRHDIPVIFDMAEDYVAMIRDIWEARKFQGMNLVVRNPYLAKLVERYSLRAAEHILVVVEEARDLVIGRGADPQRVTIVSNTPPQEVFEQRPSMDTADTAVLKSFRSRYSVIYTGGVQLGRGIQVVIEAIPAIVRSIPDFLFVVVGDGYATEQLKAKACNLGVQDYVRWVGWVDHTRILDYIRACQVGVIPHFVTDHVNTTIPNKIFDYMGLGLPVIASDSVPMQRILCEEGCGITFKSGDASDLVRAILELAGSGMPYGEQGIRAVQGRYNWQADTQRLLKVIELIGTTDRATKRGETVAGVVGAGIKFLEITHAKPAYADQITAFLERLDTERKYFNLTEERLHQSDAIVAALDGDEIIGLGGVETKFGITRNLLMLDKRYHGQGIARPFLLKVHEVAKKGHNIILGVVDENNIKMLRLDMSIGFEIVGKRENLCYLFCPLNSTGRLMLLVIKTLFPFVKVLDFLRN